jgi:hypothetical protein
VKKVPPPDAQPKEQTQGAKRPARPKADVPKAAESASERPTAEVEARPALKPGRPSGSDIIARARADAKRPADGFDPAEAGLVEVNPRVPATPNLRSQNPNDAMSVLHDAKPPGVYIIEGDGDGRGTGVSDDPELLAAVAEAKRRVADIAGILRVGPGMNEAGAKVVLIVAERGFSEESMQRVPPEVRGFPTLLALDYDLLPLRRRIQG